MSLQYILDGYNIMRHAAYSPRGKMNDPRYGLIAFVRDEALCGSAKNRVTVVFDGFPSGFDYDDGRFRAVFSGDVKADERIKAMIESSAERKIIIVVSDDREIRDFAVIHGVKTEHVEEFLGKRRNAWHEKNESVKPELTYEKMHRINQELRDTWLK
jgi:hypothetical protein